MYYYPYDIGYYLPYYYGYYPNYSYVDPRLYKEYLVYNKYSYMRRDYPYYSTYGDHN